MSASGERAGAPRRGLRGGRPTSRVVAAIAAALVAGTGGARERTEGSPAEPPPLVAFPGAEGGGALSVGGRGGKVLEVRTLDDSGRGSLRSCLAADAFSGLAHCRDRACARTCVFAVGGTITLRTPVEITKPYLTVAGQTAPGGGIQIRSAGVGVAPGALIVGARGAHDLIFRYLRLRPGRCPLRPQGCAGFSFWGGHGIVVDHVSAGWDNNKWLSLGYGVHHSTFSWNLAAEGFASHSTGPLLVSRDRAQADAMVELDGHHNLLATFDHRLPLVEAKRFRWINNYVFNYGFGAHSSGGIELDVVGNVWRIGSMAPTRRRKEWGWHPRGEQGTPSGVPSIHAANNFGPSNPAGAGHDYERMFCDVTRDPPNENNDCVAPLDPAYERAAPLPALPVPITATHLASPADLLALLEPDVGASRAVGCDGRWRPARDALDARVLAYVKGLAPAPRRPPQDETSLGGLPWLAPGTPCPDADGDGLPDAFEERYLPGCAHDDGRDDPRCGPNGRSACGGGWTNLECWLNGTR